MLEIKNVYKTYSTKNGITHKALENISLKFDNTGLCFILGKSGSGKSTLLNIIGGLDSFDRGNVYFNNQDFNSFSNSDFDYYRNKCVGFVFQDFNLLDNLTVYENVLLALDLQNKKDDGNISSLLEKMEILDLKNKKCNELSGGQKQRVAIARALIKNPSIILADEPTGSLDSNSATGIIEILRELSKDRLVIVVTHDKDLAFSYGNRIIEIKDGYVIKDIVPIENDSNKDNVTLLHNNLLYVPKDEKIEQKHLDLLNSTIAKKRQDYYLVVDSNKYLAMSLNPNIKEIIDKDDNKETYRPYVNNDENKDNNYKKESTKIKTSRAIKFGFSNLNKKKIRLFFTIVLALMSILLIGVISNFNNYKLSSAVASSIKKDSGKYLEVSSSFAISDSTYKLQKNDISYIDNLNKDVAYSYDISLAMQFSNQNVRNAMSQDPLFSKCIFKGMLVSDNIETLGYQNNNFKIIKKLENATENDIKEGFYLSSCIANTIVKYDAYDNTHPYPTIDSLIGTRFRFSDGNYYMVLGIYDVDENQSLYNKFKILHDDTSSQDLVSEYNNLYNSILSRLVVSESFIENIKNKTTSRNFFGMTMSTRNSAVSASSIRKISNINPSATDTVIRYFDDSWNNTNFEQKINSLKDNQIFVSRDFYQRIFGTYYADDDFGNIPDSTKETVRNFNNSHNYLTIQSTISASTAQIYCAIADVEIIGVITRNRNDNLRGMYITDSLFNEALDNYYQPNRALISMNYNDNYEAIIDDIYNNGLTINNEFVEYFLKLITILEKYSFVLHIATIIIFVLSALLLYSFINNSIKNSSKEIGILRALGSNTKDIYKIYSIEGIIIGISTIILSLLAYYFGALLINKIITNYYTFYYAAFLFNYKIVLAMVLSTLVIIIVSTIIPLTRIKNIKPIDVIKCI